MMDLFDATPENHQKDLALHGKLTHIIMTSFVFSRKINWELIKFGKSSKSADFLHINLDVFLD